MFLNNSGKNNIFAIRKIGYDKDTSSIFGVEIWRM